MKYILLKAFTGSRMDNISIYSSSARWTNNPRSDTISVDEELLQEMLNYLIDNVYFTVGKQVFRQTIGIPMGTDCAPFLANLFLYYYEFKYMDRMCKENYSLAKKLSFTWRYIDDLITLNSDGYFDEIRTDIYPESLKLNKENADDSHASFLDLNITVKNEIFHTSLYDKRDAFSFNIVNFPDLSGNIPKKSSYGVFISQLLRYAIACKDFKDFECRCKILIRKLMTQYYDVNILKKTFTKFGRKYQENMKKYDISCARIKEELFGSR